MNNPTDAIAKIRNRIIKGLAYQFAPLIIIGSIQSIFNLDSAFDLLPEAISLLLALYVLGLFWWGYIICLRATYQYAVHKGYPKQFGLLGIFSLLGIALLFILKNKNVSNSDREDNQPFKNLNLVYLTLGSFAIMLLLSAALSFTLVAIVGIKAEAINEYINSSSFDTSYLYFICFFFGVISAIALFILREVKTAGIQLNKIIGSLKLKQIQLPISLGVALFLFVLGINRTVLYLLAFVVPNYVQAELNRGTNEITVAWLVYALLWLIIVPLLREFIFQGIVFQKLSIDRDSIFKGVWISLLIYLIIGIFLGATLTTPIFGLVQIVLYLKTKQIIAPVISNFVSNSLSLARTYLGIVSGQEYFTNAISIADYQSHFINHLPLNILFIAISVPYLGYFIYRHYPRSSKISNLPYFSDRL